MSDLTHDLLDRFETALTASDFDEIETIRAAFKMLPHPHLARCLDVSTCMRFLTLMDRMLVFKPEKEIEMAYRYSNADWVHAIAAGHIEGLLSGDVYWRRKAPHTLPITAQDALTTVPNWCATFRKTPARVEEVFFKALENQSTTFAEIMRLLIVEAENAGALTANSVKAIEAAHNQMQALEVRNGWPEEISSTEFEADIVPLLDGPHRVTRNLGGWALGNIYGMGSAQEIDAMGAPTHTDMLHLIAEKQQQNGDIVDSFVHAGRLEIEWLGILNEWPLEAGFDWQDWILSLYCAYETADPVIGQPLWFPIHEFFANDLGAVMRLIDNGKYFAAKLTAEENWLPHMKPAVERLATLADRDIADEARYSLAHYWPLREQQRNV